MRLRSIKDNLEKARELLVFSVVERPGNPVTYRIQNIPNLNQAIGLLDQSNLFKDQIDELKKLSFHEASTENLIVARAEYNVLYKTINNLQDSIDGTIKALSMVIYDDNPDLISIKIPDPRSFKDIAEISKSLDKIFSQTLFHEDINGNYKITNFDTGSYWIDILVSGGGAVMHFVAALAWGGAVVYKKIQEGRLLKEQVTALKISNEATKEINEKNKIAENAVALNEAEFIYNTFYKGQSPEQIGRIKVALTELAKLYSQGTEIYPNIEAAKDVKNEFPNIKAIDKIKSKVKALPPKQ